jgi:hypothetical protein
MGKTSEKPTGKILLNYSGKNIITQKTILKWRKEQTNVNLSVLSLIEHAIDKFGYQDLSELVFERHYYEPFEIGEVELNLKAKMIINYENKSDELKDKILRWRRNQSNLTGNVLSLIEHAINTFGFVDLLDHEIQRRLYQGLLFSEGEKVRVENPQTFAQTNTIENNSKYLAANNTSQEVTIKEEVANVIEEKEVKAVDVPEKNNEDQEDDEEEINLNVY